MDSKSNSNQRIKNDYKPDYDADGNLTETQIISEFSYLFDHVFNGYQLPFQLRKFAFKLFTLTKGEQTYSISDEIIAQQLGNTSRNYVVKLRAKLKEWFNSETDGIRNFQFVSIKENSYDHAQKKQLPTEYTFNQEFRNLLTNLGRKARKNKHYKNNWILAIKETCGENKETLLDFGFWENRKKRSERSAEKIAQTYLLHFKTHTAKTLDFFRKRGISPEIVKERLKQIIDETYSEMNLKQVPKEHFINLRGELFYLESGFEYQELTLDSLQLVEKTKEETVFPTNYKTNPVAEENSNVWSSTQQFITDSERRNGYQSESLDQMDEFRTSISDLPGSQNKTTLDNARKRFLEKHKGRNGNISEPSTD